MIALYTYDACRNLSTVSYEAHRDNPTTIYWLSKCSIKSAS